MLKLSNEEAIELSDKCVHFASLLRDNKHSLLAWRYITSETANELVTLIDNYNLTNPTNNDKI